MKKKLGPLPLWQWLVIGTALGIGVYLYRRDHAAAGSTATPADAQFNPIDPTTGLPFAGFPAGATGAPVTAASPADFSSLLDQFGQLTGLLSSIQGLQADAPQNTDQSTVTTATGAAPAPGKTKQGSKANRPSNAHLLNELKGSHSPAHTRHIKDILKQRGVKIPKQPKRTKSPGHHTTHGGNRSSSAPHNPRQHTNTAPPAHERHHTTKHPSARGPGVRR